MLFFGSHSLCLQSLICFDCDFFLTTCHFYNPTALFHSVHTLFDKFKNYLLALIESQNFLKTPFKGMNSSSAAYVSLLKPSYVTVYRKNVPHIVKQNFAEECDFFFVNTVKTSAVPEEIKGKHCLIRRLFLVPRRNERFPSERDFHQRMKAARGIRNFLCVV